MSWNKPDRQPTFKKDVLLIIRHKGEPLQQVGFLTESGWFLQSVFGPIWVANDKVLGWKAIDADNLMIPVAQRKWRFLLEEGAKLSGFMFNLDGKKGMISTFGKVNWVE